MGIFVFDDFIGGIRANMSRYESYQRASDFIYILQDQEWLSSFLTENQFFYHQGIIKPESELKLYFINKNEIAIVTFDEDSRINITRYRNEFVKLELNNLDNYKQSADLKLYFKNGEELSFSSEKDSNDKTLSQYYKGILSIYDYYLNEL
jgi:hypothetical protein